jgi:hypothetical protein
MLCNPHFTPVGRALNIASTVFGILWSVWIPVVIYVGIVAAALTYV